MLDKDRDLKIGIFDIETSDLNAYFGYVFCACVKELGKKKIEIYRIDSSTNVDKFNDKRLIEKFIDRLNDFDLLVGWYSSAFDFVFLNTRAGIHGIEPPVKNYRRDLCFVARGNYRLPNNKLKTACKVLLGVTRKTETTPDIKLGAIRGEKKALDFIVDHCVRDVKDTEDIYYKMMPLLSKRLRKN